MRSSDHSPVLHRSVVFHQLDDLNALGDALAAASAEGDAERIAVIRSSMDRFVVALGWDAEAAIPAVIAYVEARARFEDDLFAPGLILSSIAPGEAQTVALLARLSADVRDRLAYCVDLPRR